MKEYKIQELISNMEDKYTLSSLDIASSSSNLVYTLLSHVKNTNINSLKLSQTVILTDEEFNFLDKYIHMVSSDSIPIQYITNNVNIYNENYFVNENVLIPRQDTETLIELAINIINNNSYKTMLDLCSGSGVIGISIAKNSNITDVTMSDVSKDTIKVASINIVRNEMQNKCRTLVSNMFDKLYETKNKYDIIVSNPPYLTKQEVSEVSDFVKCEPVLALDGGEDGLEFYRLIYNEARHFLNNNGTVIVEIGSTQAKDVTDIIKSYKEYSNVQVTKDINSNDRVVICRFQRI